MNPIIGILAGEASGDILGAGLMRELKTLHPTCTFVGIGGPRMMALGLESLVPMERLSMNLFVDPVRRLPELIRILMKLIRCYRAKRPAVFIGVDFNVFNLFLEGLLKRRGITTVHYVSPSVYAWRRGRVKRVARAADMLLTLYPFEPEFYAGLPIDTVYVGHPLADEIGYDDGSDDARMAARRELGLPEERLCIALLPGSRMSEVSYMADTFLSAADLIKARIGEVGFVVPCLRGNIATWLKDALERHRSLDVVQYDGNARLALVACDAAIVKSGTGTLEAMLLRRPMVVSYKLGEFTFQILRRIVRTPFVALPNILTGRMLVPELLQNDATPEALADNLLSSLSVLDKASQEPETLLEFARLHELLRQGADKKAAQAVARLLA
ncbi:MAG: lipid-A-disaccharide synthase [Gammaproteobacteria bacterium]|nr:lipid-A-disaccharide synthase [Gammaproteobacteria bacterium]MCZ6854922.1 lipid-A-disaccharide synthase [Gammaproteobacteria bacterium]